MLNHVRLHKSFVIYDQFRRGVANLFTLTRQWPWDIHTRLENIIFWQINSSGFPFLIIVLKMPSLKWDVLQLIMYLFFITIT